MLFQMTYDLTKKISFRYYNNNLFIYFLSTYDLKKYHSSKYNFFKNKFFMWVFDFIDFYYIYLYL